LLSKSRLLDRDVFNMLLKMRQLWLSAFLRLPALDCLRDVFGFGSPRSA
jgi:hypothetical protein